MIQVMKRVVYSGSLNHLGVLPGAHGIVIDTDGGNATVRFDCVAGRVVVPSDDLSEPPPGILFQSINEYRGALRYTLNWALSMFTHKLESLSIEDAERELRRLANTEPVRTSQHSDPDAFNRHSNAYRFAHWALAALANAL